MSLSQQTATGSIGNPTPKYMFDQSAGNDVLNPLCFTAMMWTYHTGGTTDDYQDIFCVRDSTIGANPGDDQIIGISSRHQVGNAGRDLNIGDVDSDFDGLYFVPDNEWHHVCMTAETVVGAPDLVRTTGYLDGIQHARSDDVSLIPPRFPGTDCWVQLFNTRSSNTDVTSVWIGHMSALKIWNNVILTPDEIFAEMWSYNAAKKEGIWAVNPMRDTVSAQFNLVNPTQTWLVQGANFTTSDLEPPGVSWDPPYARRGVFLSPVTFAQEGFWFRKDDGDESDSTSYKALVIADGADNYWRLNEGSPATGFLDIIGNNTSTPTALGGYIGAVPGAVADDTGLTLAGTPLRATLGSSISTGTTFTIECWVRNSTSVNGPILCNFSTGKGFIIGFSSGNRFIQWFDGTQHNSTTALGTGLRHIALSVNAGAATFYLDGVSDGTFSGVVDTSLDSMFRDNFSDFMKADLIDELAFYGGVALTGTQLLNHFNARNKAAASYVFAQDQNIRQQLEVNTRLRMLVDTAGDAASTQYQLEFRKVGDPSWTKVDI